MEDWRIECVYSANLRHIETTKDDKPLSLTTIYFIRISQSGQQCGHNLWSCICLNQNLSWGIGHNVILNISWRLLSIITVTYLWSGETLILMNIILISQSWIDTLLWDRSFWRRLARATLASRWMPRREERGATRRSQRRVVCACKALCVAS